MTTPQQPDPVDLQQWFAAAQRAAPIVGAVILIWSAFEIILNQDILEDRWRTSGTAMDSRVQHRLKDRLTEWIKRLDVVGRVAAGDMFRTEARRLGHIRNNLSHNVQAMWIDTTNELRIFTTWPNKDFEKEYARWEKKPIGAPPSPLASATYSGDDIQAAYNDIQSCIQFALTVREELKKALGA